jgi:hypothetical protein
LPKKPVHPSAKNNQALHAVRFARFTVFLSAFSCSDVIGAENIGYTCQHRISAETIRPV